jgi:hypothetical protein
MTFRTVSLAALAAASFAAPAAASTTVLANNPAPGDAFTNPGSSNQGQAVGTSGWYYNNVRNSGVVGISTANPRSGNGSVAFGSPDGAAKADIEFLPNAISLGGNFVSVGSLGAFSALQSFGFDWYRDGASTNPAVQHPALRVLVDLDGDLLTPDRAGLVFERAYNSLPTLTDQWVTDLVGATTNLWSFGALGFATGGYSVTLADWQANPLLANAVIVGFSAGVGSGWNGVFTGYVDNIGWTIGGESAAFNFEVPGAVIPEPATWAMLIAGFGLAGVALRRRRPALA